MLNICITLQAYGKNRERVVGRSYEPIPPQRRAVEIAYKYTHRDSILQRVFKDWCSVCTMSGDATLRDWLLTVPEFAADLLVSTARKEAYFKRTESDYLLRLTGKEFKAF